MLKKSSIIMFPLALSAAAMIFLSSLNSCGGKSSEQGQSTDSTQVKEESSTSSVTSGTKKYELKSGIVHYKPVEIMKGAKSQETLYFDDYGQKEAKETVTEINMMGISNKETNISILDGDYSITYSVEKIENGKNVTEKVAKKMKLTSEMKAMVNMAAMFTDEKKLKENYDYKEEGTETVAGMTGKKFSMKLDKSKSDRINVVTYKNILLKTEMMKIKIEVDKFEENVPVPADKFKVPAGYKIEEVDASQAIPGMHK
jgi:hypothetical protein